MTVISIALIVFGTACFAFGMADVFNESKMHFHLFWIALGVALATIGAAMAAGLWDSLPVGIRLSVEAALAALALYELVGHALILRHFRDAAEPGLDCVIMLGAQVLESGPGRTLATRLDAACDYLAASPRTHCITCGGQGPSEPTSEARAGADYLVKRGIERERISLEQQSGSTFQNLRNAAALVDPAHDRVSIVTNDYHVFRVLLLARKAGFAHPTGIVAKAPARFPVDNTVRETFAIAKDLIRRA